MASQGSMLLHSSKSLSTQGAGWAGAAKHGMCGQPQTFVPCMAKPSGCCGCTLCAFCAQLLSYGTAPPWSPQFAQLFSKPLPTALAAAGHLQLKTSSHPPQKYRPDVADLPTTNGAWAQGEGIQLGQALGAKLLHMDQVQVHPTGFVDPTDPNNGTKVGACVVLGCMNLVA